MGETFKKLLFLTKKSHTYNHYFIFQKEIVKFKLNYKDQPAALFYTQKLHPQGLQTVQYQPPVGSQALLHQGQPSPDTTKRQGPHLRGDGDCVGEGGQCHQQQAYRNLQDG